MKKFVFIIFSLALLALASGATLYWLSTQRIHHQLDRFADQVSSIGQLSWGQIVITPAGRAIISDLTFRPQHSRDSIRADQTTIRSGSLPQLLQLAPRLSQGEIPRQMSLTIETLRLPILDLFSDLSLEQTGLLLPLRTQGCEGFEQMRIEQLLDLNYGQLFTDATLSYQITEDRIQLTLEIQSDDLSEITLRTELEASQPINQLDQLSGLLDGSHLLSFDYQFRDNGIVARLDAACSNQLASQSSANLVVSAKIENHLGAWLRTWTNHGLQPSALVQAGYRYFLERDRALIAIKAQPDPAIPISEILGNEINDFIQDLNLSFAIDNGPELELVTRAVRSTRPAIQATEENEPSQQLAIKRSTDMTESTIVVGPAPSWQAISAAQIMDHDGAQARITLLDGSRMRGRIAGVEEARLQLLIRSLQGEFVRPLELAAIESIEVRP